MARKDTPDGVDELLETPDLAVSLEDGRFRQLLDYIPIALAVSELVPAERVLYLNAEFEALTGLAAETLLGEGWSTLPGETGTPPRALREAILEDQDYLGPFEFPQADGAVTADVWSNIVTDDDGGPAFRLIALVKTAAQEPSVLEELHRRVIEKDTQLRELQHRVKNNLQMITALIRIEARGVSDLSTGQGFDRLAGRVEALGLLYHALAGADPSDTVDLGVYLSEIALAVMRAHGVEGIHLDLQVDNWPVSIDVAMPAGLVVNELLTNALKHAFKGRDSGTITLHTLAHDGSCRIVVADDGVGLPQDVTWPKPGKLSALIVRSLIQNSDADLDVQSRPGQGMRVVIALAAGKRAVS